MFRNGIFAALTLAVVLPATAPAQYVSAAHGPIIDRFSLEPYAGRYFDNVGSGAARFDESGWLGGLRVGLEMADRARLLGNVAYSQVDALGQTALPATRSAETWMLTGGLELDVVPGDTRASLSMEGGRAWRRLQGAAVEGDPGVTTDLRHQETVLVPGFSITQRIAPRADIRLGVHDYIWLGAEPVSHNWTAVVGLRLR